MTNTLDYNLPFRPFLRMVNEIDRAIQYRNSNKSKTEGYYNYIPIHEEELLPILTRLYRNGPFLDVGCGSGRVLAIARYILNIPVRGIECISAVAKAGMKAYGLDIDIGDAFEVITPEYLNGVGYIYTYMPISNQALMTKLHLHIMASYPKGQEYTRIEMLPKYLGVGSGQMVVKMWT